MMSIQSWLEELQTSTHKQQQAFMVVNIALGILILITAFNFIQTSWLALSFAETPTPHYAHTLPSTTVLPKISTWHIFGKYEPSLAGDDIPQTMLNLHLLGIFLSDVPGDSSVVISSNNGISKTYYLNDNLPEGGAVLYHIYNDHVILKFNDRYESLNLPKTPENKTNASGMPSSMHVGPTMMPGFGP
jgi:type II secretory pathway component PulC